MKRVRVAKGLRAVTQPPRRAVVTIGMFDGVHLGHQRLVTTAIRTARRIHGTSVVLTFDPDPQRVVDPRHGQPALMPLEARIRLLASLGVDWIWVIPFTRAFSQTQAAQFIRQVLAKRLRAAWVVVGEDFAFGSHRRGDLALLTTLGRANGMQVRPVSAVVRTGEVISSSRIRRLISGGHLGKARRLLGRPPELYGVVVHGAGRGHRFRMPTINIHLSSEVLPPQGVYAVVVHAPQRGGRWRGVMNLGIRPTFGGGPVVCEIHLLKFSGALYGQPVTVSMVARLRGERCFPSPQALYHQVRHDIRRANRVLARRTS